MERVMLLLGGNIGDVEGRIDYAVELIESSIGRVLARSTMLKSEPWGFEDRVGVTPPFVNQAVVVESDLLPEELLDVTQRVELESGRDRAEELSEKEVRGERYASRMIDIDIILYGEQSYKSERLKVPHPLMQEREFVLVPIVEISPEWRHPVLKCECRELLEELKKRDICNE